MNAADIERLTDFVRTRHPGIEIEVFDDGWDHLVIAAGEMGYRFPRDGDGRALSLEAESAFLRRFSTTTAVQVPALAIHERSGTAYATFPFLRGVPLTSSTLASLPDSVRERLASDLGAFLSALHSFPLDEARQIGVGEADAWSERVVAARTEVLPRLPSRAAEWVRTLFERHGHLAALPLSERRVIHADMGLHHLFLDPERHGLAGVIDFGDMTIGDPAQDFGFESQCGRAFLDQVYAEYEPGRGNDFDARRLLFEARFIVFDFLHAWGRDKQEGFGHSDPGETQSPSSLSCSRHP